MNSRLDKIIRIWCFIVLWAMIVALLSSGCRTKKLDSNVKTRREIRSELAYLNDNVKISTQNHAYFADNTQSIVMEENITVTEYDEKSGKPVKETNAKRKIAQNSNQVVKQEENQSVRDSSQTKNNRTVEKKNTMDGKTKEEFIGGQESFGKWFGIIIGVTVVAVGIILYFYIRKKIAN